MTAAYEEHLVAFVRSLVDLGMSGGGGGSDPASTLWEKLQ